MIEQLRTDADAIVAAGIKAVLPDEAVKRALKDFAEPNGRILLVAAGKAAWQMAKAASEMIEPDAGIVITKYGHVKGEIQGVQCYEAGHPVPDANGFEATAKALDMVEDLTADDAVIFLLSGGGSALFELPLISGSELQSVTRQLLEGGADISEINTVRKRLSAVKGGRFALACAPAHVYSILLSDVLGDHPDVIASGPAYPDPSTCEEAIDVAERYGLGMSSAAWDLLSCETPKELDNVTTVVTGSVRELCRAVESKCKDLGYETVFLTDELCCEAAEAGSFLGSIARSHANKLCAHASGSDARRRIAFIAGGETVVHVYGEGLGGRNQELALSAALYIDGLDAAVVSFGSDGTDGPTDAAGGYVDGDTLTELLEKGIDPAMMLSDNDSYNALKETGGLIITGPTGTNVNDAAVVLIR